MVLSKPLNVALDVLRLLRPHQWLKSGFVFVGLLFARAWGDLSLTFDVVIAAIAFIMVASGIYILNDFADRERDRNHPKKRLRPLAAQTVSIPAALTLMGLLFVAGLLLGLSVSLATLLLLIVYVAVNIGYSLGLKHVVLLDVFLLASGFVLRILVGTLGVGIEPSKWLIFTGMMVALFLGLAKRRAELIKLKDSSVHHRKVLQDYSDVFLDKAIVISATCTVMAYGLYTLSPSTIAIHGTENLLYTVPFVVYGVFRYLHLLHQSGGGGDPSKELVRDPHLFGVVIVWLVAVLWIIQ